MESTSNQPVSGSNSGVLHFIGTLERKSHSGSIVANPVVIVHASGTGIRFNS